LGNKTESVISAVRSLIKDTSNKLAFELLPIKAPTSNLSANDISVQLSKPPAYKLGEEVSAFFVQEYRDIFFIYLIYLNNRWQPD
jgi:hypothetical protein